MMNKPKTILKILGIISLITGLIPFLKPYINQLSIIPTSETILAIEILIIGLIAAYFGFSKSVY